MCCSKPKADHVAPATSHVYAAEYHQQSRAYQTHVVVQNSRVTLRYRVQHPSVVSEHGLSFFPLRITKHSRPRRNNCIDCIPQGFLDNFNKPNMFKPQEGATTSSTFMSKLQKADYLQDLRRTVSRPSGSRPPPPSKYTNRTAAIIQDSTEDGRPTLQQTNSLPIMPSQQVTHRQSRSSITNTKSLGRPLAKAPTEEEHELKSKPSLTYLDSGTRWMEKQEAKSLRQALSDMDLAEEQRVHKAAQDEAAELVWKHQNPNAAYKNPDQKDYKSHLRKGSYHRSNADAAPVIASRSSSGSSIEAMTATSKVVPVRKVSTTTDTRRVGQAYGELADLVRKDIAESRRRTSSGSRRLMSGGQKHFMHPDDKIWEDAEENPRPFSAIPELKPAPAASVPAYVRKNPFARVRMQQDRFERSNSAPLLGQAAKRERVEIQRNPPSQSRNPEYTSSHEALPQVEAEEMEKRSDDIRAATSKLRKDRSPRLPQPTLVSDKPGRPIVSFQQETKPREVVLEEVRPSSADSRPSSSATVSRTPYSTVPTISAPEEPRAIPTICLPTEPRMIPTICLPGDDGTATQNIPTICLPDDGPTRGLPTIALPGETPSNAARPLPSQRSAPLKSTPHYSPSLRQSNVLCAHCALPIAGRVLSAAGERFHPGCFVCHGCECNLELVAFYPEPETKRAERIERIRARQAGELLDDGVADGDETLRFYCHLDFHETFSPRCKSCKTPIEGEIIIACGAEWHAGHFFCAQCGDPFDSKTPFVEKEGYAWKCRKPVIDVVVKALGADWHSECFRCQECNGDFGDGRYFLRGASQDPVCDFTPASRRKDTQALANTITPATTASQTTSWLPPPSDSLGQTPQPVFQDFELLPPTRQQAARATSLDSTQQPLFNANQQAFPHANSVYNISTATRTRPPVPLFHANSTGNIPAMGGANVAYHDTMGDLFEAGSSFGDFHMFSNDFTAVNAPGTVSPKDLMNGSVPPSTTFTNLTTPGSTYLETPDDSYEASPLYNDNLGNAFDYSETNNFFPDLDALVPMGRTASSSSVSHVVVHPGGPASARKRSVAPASPAIRPSSVAGVNARKRDKPLPPIMVDENDPVALKRARNTAAARKSRARKVEERDVLEARIADLEAQLRDSQTENAALSGERDYWKAKAGDS
ncbi:hypothetical protein AMS68_007211 [Peltaster fructicola]|uniref:LIM zinc-binding domain-containing protein n=1 Tax=Peltaster fructicola TaxID=286661 RepID=A0A6H0Y3V7_9PEZI|nr:hypothetical protein AMS68_007211 [Peltaster fructicola]